MSGRFELDEEGCLEVYRTLYRDGVTVNGAPFDRVEPGHAYLLSARVNTLGVIGATSVIGGHLALQPEFDAFFVSSASGFVSRKLWSGEGDVYFSTDRRAEGDEPVLQEALELLMQAYIAKRHVKHKDPVKYVSADVVIDPELCPESLLRMEFEHNGKMFAVSIPGEFAEGYSRVYRPWTDVCPERPGQQTAKLYRMDGDRMEPQLLSSAYAKITRLDSAWSVTLEGAAPSPWTGALTLSVSAGLSCPLQRVQCPEWGELDVSPAVQLKEGEPCAR